MREVTSEWLYRIRESYELSWRTFHLGLNILDRVSNLIDIKSRNYQLVAGASMWLADKVNEIHASKVKDWVMLTQQYTEEQFLLAERVICEILHFALCPDLVYDQLVLPTLQHQQFMAWAACTTELINYPMNILQATINKLINQVIPDDIIQLTAGWLILQTGQRIWTKKCEIFTHIVNWTPLVVVTLSPSNSLEKLAPVICLQQSPKFGPKLGEGTFGKVYSTQGKQNIVAVKHYRQRAGGYSESMLRELGIMQRQITGLIPLLEIWTYDDEVYSVMPLCLEEFKPQHFQQIVIALNNLHQAGYLHRDLKPDNILVKDNTAFLADFSLITHISNKKEFEAYSMDFRPPEVLLEQDYSFKADIWSLGATFYRVLYPKQWKLLYTRKEHLTRIFNMFGSFSQEEWPEAFPQLERIYHHLLPKPIIIPLVIWSMLQIRPWARPNLEEIQRLL